jgi:hypothetical protein
MLTRRDFIKFVSSISAMLLPPIHRFGKGLSSNGYTQEQSTGELFSGFILLPEDALIPDFVRFPVVPDYDRCGMVSGGNNSTGEIVMEYLDNIQYTKGQVNFALYDFAKLPDGLRKGTVAITRDRTGNILEITIPYELAVSTDEWITPISLKVLPNTYQPYPLWFSNPAVFNEPNMILEKADYLPTHGIKTDSREGYLCFWIENGVLYQLIAEPSPTGQDARSLANLLEKV